MVRESIRWWSRWWPRTTNLVALSFGFGLALAPVSISPNSPNRTVAHLAAQSPERTATVFATAWQSQDTELLTTLLTPAGVRLQLREEQPYERVPPPRVIASLKLYRTGRTPGEVTVDKVVAFSDHQNNAYAVLTWSGHRRRSGEPFQVTIFLGLTHTTHTTDAWLVDEIRALPVLAPAPPS